MLDYCDIKALVSTLETNRSENLCHGIKYPIATMIIVIWKIPLRHYMKKVMSRQSDECRDTRRQGFWS